MLLLVYTMFSMAKNLPVAVKTGYNISSRDVYFKVPRIGINIYVILHILINNLIYRNKLHSRLFGILQKEHPQGSDLHLQGPGGFQGQVPDRQDSQESVSSLPFEEMLRVSHEQGW